jgi:hypothetical protein
MIVVQPRHLEFFASSVSRHIVDITGRSSKVFKKRDLSDFSFAIFIDTIHRGGEPLWFP